MKYFLAIDIGASSGRHIVGWREDGELRTKEVYRFHNGVQEQADHLVWDMDALLAHVKAGIAAAKAEFPGIVSLAIDTWGVENVMVLSKLKEAKHIDIHVDMSELDVTSAEAENGATYEEIKAYVQEHFGVKVSALNIAQVKRKYGIIERECYNKAKAEDARQPRCPEEKEKAIEAAMRFFGMIK